MATDGDKASGSGVVTDSAASEASAAAAIQGGKPGSAGAVSTGAGPMSQR